MTGLDTLVVGYLGDWALRKTRRADGSADPALDVMMDRLESMVHDRIGAEPAIVRLEREAARGPATEPTRRQAEQAVAAAAAADEEFGSRLRLLVDELRAAAPRQVTVHATASGQAKMPVQGSGTQHNTFS